MAIIGIRRKDYEEALQHSAKGTTWKEHKYTAIKNGRYIYPDQDSRRKAERIVSDHDMRRYKTVDIKRDYEYAKQKDNLKQMGYDPDNVGIETFTKMGFTAGDIKEMSKLPNDYDQLIEWAKTKGEAGEKFIAIMNAINESKQKVRKLDRSLDVAMSKW